MRLVTLHIGLESTDPLLSFEHVHYFKKNGFLATTQDQFDELQNVPAWHGLTQYIPSRQSYIIPAFRGDQEGNVVEGYAELRKNQAWFRSQTWLAKLPRLEQVPAADSLEIKLRADVCGTATWQELPPEHRLLEFERVLNQLGLIQYIFFKREHDKTLQYQTIWWDAFKMQMPDGTVLEVDAEGIRTIHAESGAVSCTFAGPKGQRVMYDSLYISTTAAVGHA